MTHIDDWLDDRHADGKESYAAQWLEHYRRPAMSKDWKWLSANPLFCTYQGARYRCIGCSRLGDVWLSKDFGREVGYDLRIDVADCSDWGTQANA